MSLCAGAKCEVIFTCTVQHFSTLACKAASCFSPDLCVQLLTRGCNFLLI